jgi:hypothetical protein
MTTLLANKVDLKWTQKWQEAFEALKEKLTTTLVLVLHDVHKAFLVYCNASYTGFGCVLIQEERVIGPVWFSFFLTSFYENLVVERIWLCIESEYH